jgi:protein-S-isoprenylcysteine O-methyltransferase Ste14
MDEAQIYRYLLYGIFAVAAVTALALVFVTAPYGRHVRRGWGPTIPSTAGWLIMETPAVLTIALCFWLGDRRTDPVAIAFIGMWQLHYLNRTFVFPLRRRGGGRPMPLTVVAMAIVFNVWNGYLNGRWLFELGPRYDSNWFLDPRFLVGAALFLVGFAINQQSDEILRRLRRPGETGYSVPRGGLFRFVSAPNYLGELIEWTGWALLTWSVAGLSFAVFTAANLVPRAVSNHRWYKQQFPDYPKRRKAIVPFLL